MRFNRYWYISPWLLLYFIWQKSLYYQKNSLVKRKTKMLAATKIAVANKEFFETDPRLSAQVVSDWNYEVGQASLILEAGFHYQGKESDKNLPL